MRSLFAPGAVGMTISTGLSGRHAGWLCASPAAMNAAATSVTIVRISVFSSACPRCGRLDRRERRVPPGSGIFERLQVRSDGRVAQPPANFVLDLLGEIVRLM